MKASKKKLVSIAASAIVTILLLVLLFEQVPFADVIAALAKLPFAVLSAGFGLYVAIHVFRGIRFWLFLKGAVPVEKMFSIMCVHNALLNLLPFRAGELSYFYLMKSQGKTKLGTNLGTLALARLFDLFAISILFFIAVVFIPELPRFADTARLVISLVVGILILKLSFLILFSKKAIRLGQSLFEFFGIHEHRISKLILSKAEDTLHTLHVVKSGRIVIGALACSLGIWFLQFMIGWMIFSAIGIKIGIFSVILASSVAALLSVLPIQGILGFGTTEAYWTAALVGVGISSSNAIQAGFVVHLVIIAYFLVLGAYGALRLGFHKL